MIERKVLISLCIPTYKQPLLIKRLLDSISKQKFRNFEVIVSDDSPDSSVEDVCLSYKSFPLKYVKNEKSLGSPRNWNNALSLAKAEYQILIHHDDWLLTENSLELIADYLSRNPETDVLLLDYFNVSESSGLYTRHTISESSIKKLSKNPYYLFPGNLIGPPSVVLYRTDFNMAYDLNLKWVVDIEFYIRLLSLATNIKHFNEPLICVTWESEHQATAELQGKTQTELFEWPYLGEMIWKKRRLFTWSQIIFFKDLFRIHRVYSSVDLKKFGHEHISWPLRFSLFLARSIKKIKGE